MPVGFGFRGMPSCSREIRFSCGFACIYIVNIAGLFVFATPGRGVPDFLDRMDRMYRIGCAADALGLRGFYSVNFVHSVCVILRFPLFPSSGPRRVRS